MTILQINTGVNTGSTGRIAEEIGLTVMAAGGKSFIAYGRPGQTRSAGIKIGNSLDQKLHGLQTRIFDNHAFASTGATQKLLEEIDAIKPGIIHLHNLHGYYLHVGVLFNWLKNNPVPVVWTLHDCWSFTGHCTYFDSVGCEKWKTGCYECPKQKAYPSSYIFDRSKKNYLQKKQLFNLPANLHIVSPSHWLANHVQQSFLQRCPVHVIHNGVDMELFHPGAASGFRQEYNCINKKIILGVASTWDKRKGLDDFVELNQRKGEDEVIVLVGLNKAQIKSLPENMIAIQRTENVNALAGLYATADIFVNPTWQDNFPTTNIEALACGTPVITYNTGGSPESIDGQTGFVVKKGDMAALYEKVQQVLQKGKWAYSQTCRQRALQYFNKNDRYKDYINLYSTLNNPVNGVAE